MLYVLSTHANLVRKMHASFTVSILLHLDALVPLPDLYCSGVYAPHQVMRFDVAVLPAGQIARPFDLAAQSALNTALQEQYAANVPALTPSSQPIQRVRP